MTDTVHVTVELPRLSEAQLEVLQRLAVKQVRIEASQEAITVLVGAGLIIVGPDFLSADPCPSAARTSRSTEAGDARLRPTPQRA